jgi:glycosyltransferase involved in cell wall biosynthesis
MKVFVDLTEFLASQNRTGIQRVCGQTCRHWPRGESLTPVKLRSDGKLVQLPPETLSLIREYFEVSYSRAKGLKDRLAAVSRNAESFEETLDLQPDTRVLVPELFYDPNRVAFFRSLSAEQLNCFYFIIYDLLPFTHPEYFIANAPQEVVNGYTRVVRAARHVAFISSWTRDAYYRRLLRKTCSSAGPVLPLGSDGLGERPRGPALRSARPKFTVIGTIEPRKNHALILDVFEPLLHPIEGLRLVFLGQVGWADSCLRERVRSMANGGCPGFEHHADPSDELIRQHVLESWATIYISAAEGFGLPPVESLWLGTPVIASSAVPSLEAISPAGVHIVEPLNAPNLREAALAFLEGTYAKRKGEEVMSLNLPTWGSFSKEVAAWCTQDFA